VEEGDHRSLLAQGGLYARLWAHQSGGFLGEEPGDEEASVSPAPADAPGASPEPVVPGIERIRRDATG
jgi:ATP-binding cassette subfamily B multidrug efflux pump